MYMYMCIMYMYMCIMYMYLIKVISSSSLTYMYSVPLSHFLILNHSQSSVLINILYLIHIIPPSPSPPISLQVIIGDKVILTSVNAGQPLNVSTAHLPDYEECNEVYMYIYMQYVIYGVCKWHYVYTCTVANCVSMYSVHIVRVQCMHYMWVAMYIMYVCIGVGIVM